MSIDAITPDNFPSDEVERLLGYTFTDKSLLITAFTRSSYTNENPSALNNEKLEFLGDAVLGFIVSDLIFRSEISEGKLTERKKRLVSNKPLSYLCEKKGYYKYLIMGRGDRLSFSVENKNILEDLVESIIAAIYLDGGIDCARRFIFDNVLSDEMIESVFVDNVSALKEYCEKNKLGKLEYEHVDLSDKTGTHFITNVYLDGSLIASGKISAAKNTTKQDAARIALLKLLREEQ